MNCVVPFRLIKWISNLLWHILLKCLPWLSIWRETLWNELNFSSFLKLIYIEIYTDARVWQVHWFYTLYRRKSLTSLRLFSQLVRRLNTSQVLNNSILLDSFRRCNFARFSFHCERFCNLVYSSIGESTNLSEL